MKLAEADDQVNDFYVPSFLIKVGGKDVLRGLFLAVTSIEVDLKLKVPGRFSFSIDSAFDWEKREFVAGEDESRVDLLDLFAFGVSIEILLGYDEPSKLKPMLKGVVTEIGTSFAGDGTPGLTVSGYDQLYALSVGRQTRHWERSYFSDAVSAVAAANSLPAAVGKTALLETRIDQCQESDLAFIERVAERTASVFYMREGKFYFGPRRNTLSAKLELGWGAGLLGFTPTANLARQIGEAEVLAWSTADAKAWVGKAKHGDEQDRDGQKKSGGDWLAKGIGKTAPFQINAPAHSQAEADGRARAILNARAQEFVSGEGESVGWPELLPDTNVSLSGLGRSFSKVYYVNEATHILDDKGYRTRFRVEEATI